ncbi:MAG: hypothetical protein A3K19_10005 [Lentisphaerae bacterium RIFOXYB12_FULL_65_16]|nr:MAG: hypothetical protein A3K18_00740 [Lentisphaerae bacterium RIFOXYA12_64_32]OGV91283.1 MAG: hypothetical protein A3K19_10005 [Lentisphaerae bacterium RIFOXYB12_FULL_65_16]
MKKMLKIVAIVFLVFCVLGVGAFFYLTSNGFLKGTVLPKVSAAVGLPITADRIDLAAFSRLRISKLAVGEASAPILTADTILVRYKVMPLLHGELQVDEVLLDNASVVLSDQVIADLQKKFAAPAEAPKPEKPAGASAPPKAALRNIHVRNFSFRYTQGDASKGQPLTTVNLHDLNLDIPEVRNGAEFAIDLAAALDVRQAEPLDVRIGKIKTVISGKLSDAFMPDRLEVKSEVADIAGKAGPVALDGHAVRVEALIERQNETYAIRNAQVIETLKGVEEGKATIQGSVTPSPLAADVEVAVSLPQGAVLNLIGAVIGDFDFGKTGVQYTGKVKVSGEGKQFDASGGLTVSDLTIASASRKLEPLAPMAVTSEYQVAMDMTAKKLRVEKLNLNIRDPKNELMKLWLDQPVEVLLDAAGGAPAAQPATIRIQTDQLDLSIFKPFIPADKNFELLAGRLSDSLEIVVAESGQKIRASGFVELTGLHLRSAGKELRDYDVRQELEIAVSGMKEVTVTRLATLVSGPTGGSRGRLVELTVDGSLNVETLAGKLNLKLNPVTNDGLKVANLFIGEFDYGRTRIAYEGSVEMAQKLSEIRARGKLSVSDLTVEGKDVPKLAPLQITAEHDLLYAQDEAKAGAVADAKPVAQQRVKVDKLNLQVRDATRDVLKVWLDQPIELVLNAAGGAPAVPPATVRVQIDQLDLTMAQPFLPKDGSFDLLAGWLSGNLEIVIADAGQKVKATGFVELTGLHVKAAGKEFRDYDVREDVDVDVVGMKEVTLGRLATTLSGPVSGGRGKLVELAVTGALNTETLAGQVDLKLSPITNDGLKIANLFIGDLDYGKTAVSYEGSVEIGKKLSEIRARGKLAVADLTVQGKGLDLPELTPLQIAAEHDVLWQQDGKKLGIDTFTASIRDATAEIVRARLKAPVVISLAGDKPEAGSIPVEVNVQELKLTQFQPFLAAAGFKRLDGVVNMKTDVEIAQLGKEIRGTHTMAIKGVSFLMDGTGELKPLDVTVALTLATATDGMLTLRQGDVTVAAGGQELLNLGLTGAVDTARKGRKSELNLQARGPIDVAALESCFIPAQAGEKPAPPPAAKPPPADGAKPPPLWVVANADLPAILYRDIAIRDLKATAEYKENRLEIRNTRMRVNDGAVDLAAVVDLADSASPAYNAKVGLENIALKPFLAAFGPKSMPVGVDGGLKRLNATFSGKGTQKDELIRNLLADANFELDTLALSQGSSGWISMLIQQVLLSSFELGWEDLNFGAGGGKVNMKGGVVDITNLDLISNTLRLSTAGRVDGNNQWMPDVAITPAFQGQLASRLQARKIPLTLTDRKDYAAPDIVIQGPIWEKTKIAKLAVDYGVKIGKVDPNAKLATDGADALKDLGKTLKSDKPAGEKLGDAAKSIFGVIQGVEGARQEQKEREKQGKVEPAQGQQQLRPDPAKKEEPKKQDAVNQLLNSILK